MRFTLKRIEGLTEQALKEEPTGDDWLDARYNEQIHLVNHTQPYYKLFYLIAKTLKPKVVVELGGWQGTSAAHFAAGYPEATVITIDHHKDPGDDLNQIKMKDVARQYSNVTYLQGWTTPGYEEEYPKGARSVFEDVKEILGKNKVDILFIDSWHEGRYFKRDWDYYNPLLANPALVICDDVFNNHIFIDMISTFEALPGEKFTNAQVHPGIPMGFIMYGLPTDRSADTVKPKTASKRKTRTTKATGKRTA